VHTLSTTKITPPCLNYQLKTTILLHKFSNFAREIKKIHIEGTKEKRDIFWMVCNILDFDCCNNEKHGF
jgi:hypothetical protein